MRSAHPTAPSGDEIAEGEVVVVESVMSVEQDLLEGVSVSDLLSDESCGPILDSDLVEEPLEGFSAASPGRSRSNPV